jgi:hypothetical protein
MVYATSSKYSLVKKACLISLGCEARHSLKVFHWKVSDSFSASGRDIGCLPERTSDMYASVIPSSLAIYDCVIFFIVQVDYIRLFRMSTEKIGLCRKKSNNISKCLISKEICCCFFLKGGAYERYGKEKKDI